MVDLLYVLTIIAFFALMVLFVKWCEHIIGKDDALDLPYGGVEDDDPVYSPTASVLHEEVPV